MAWSENFSKQLDYYITKAGINQSDLAKALGVNKSTISHWLKGTSRPHVDSLQKIAEVLNCKVIDLTSDNNGVQPVEFVSNFDSQKFFDNHCDMPQSRGNWEKITPTEGDVLVLFRRLGRKQRSQAIEILRILGDDRK